LARLLSAELRAGDCYFLRGRVGAGKSAFSRAFVRAAAGDPYLPVPSPTFLLLNTYEVGGGAEGEDEGASGNSNSNNPHNTIPPPIHHFDLYRLDPAKTSPAELVRLDIPGALASGVALVEWPERLVAIAEGAAASGAAAATTAATTTAPLLSLVPQSRVDVYVDPLADDDPSRAELAEALLLSSGGSGGGRRLRAARLRAPSATEEEEDEEEDEDDEDDDDDDSPYADRRWRRWTLVPTSQEWEARLRERLRRAVAAAQRDGEARGGGSSEGGLFLIE
jgi:tRNA A37 threonylcarbamoyladenosine biosynthesis protein TsaE